MRRATRRPDTGRTSVPLVQGLFSGRGPGAATGRAGVPIESGSAVQAAAERQQRRRPWRRQQHRAADEGHDRAADEGVGEVHAVGQPQYSCPAANSRPRASNADVSNRSAPTYHDVASPAVAVAAGPPTATIAVPFACSHVRNWRTAAGTMVSSPSRTAPTWSGHRSQPGFSVSRASSGRWGDVMRPIGAITFAWRPLAGARWGRWRSTRAGLAPIRRLWPWSSTAPRAPPW